MDRTMYGKVDPGARQPFRCTVRDKGISPGYALLADLQNTVPGGGIQSQHHQGGYIYHAARAPASNTPGYGSLNSVRTKQSPQSPTNQVNQSRGVTEQNVSPSSFVNYNNGKNIVNINPTAGPINCGNNSGGYQTIKSTQQQHQNGSIHCNESLPKIVQQQHATVVGNLSELDCLLQDLSNARYGNTVEKKVDQHHTYGNDGVSNNGINNPVSPYAIISDVTKRPSVDSLLEELSNAQNNSSTSPIYATPNGASSPDYSTIGKTPGRHVTITVCETKTEKVTGSSSPVSTSPNYTNTSNQQLFETIQTQTIQNSQQPSPAQFASSATKELDDLMASLSDFKINASSHQHQTVVTDYAKPTKGISHLHSTTITSTTGLQPQHPHHHIQQYQQGDQLDSILGNLQANMSRQGVTTAQKGCCNACEKPIVGQVITALGKTWHPEHFTCNHCSQELGTRNFFERDGYPYCEPDYHNLFSPRCAYCNGPILDKCVTALEKTWHTEHFFCAQCGQQFGEDGFHERDGKPYCRNDYFDMFAPKCNGCNRAIMENYISALNSQWHPDCFVCRDCKKAVTGKSFYAMEGKPVCPKCVGVGDDED